MQITNELIIKALEDSWTAETSCVPGEWSIDNPARGQCVPSALVIQDFLGGDLHRYKINYEGHAEMHYNNDLPDGTTLDSTISQYPSDVALEDLTVDLKGFASIREKRLADLETAQRYTRLRTAIELILSQMS